MNKPDVSGSSLAPSILGDARRIAWEGDFPTDLREIVEPVFQPLEFILPTWCQTVVLRYVTNDDYTLQIELSIRNRWALIRVSPGWFIQPFAEREGSFIHEMCHALIEPFQWNASRALDAHGPEDGTAGRTFVDQMIKDGMEQAVEDMARAIQKALYKPPPT